MTGLIWLERTGVACFFSQSTSNFVHPLTPAIDINNRFIMLMREY